MSADTFLAAGTTTLGLAMLFLFLLVTEQIVPKGRLNEMKANTDEVKAALKDALAIIKEQNDGVQPLLGVVKELVTEVRTRLFQVTR